MGGTCFLVYKDSQNGCLRNFVWQAAEGIQSLLFGEQGHSFLEMGRDNNYTQLEEEDEKVCRMYLLSHLRSLEFLDGQVANGERDDADAFLQTDAGKVALKSLMDRMEESANRKGDKGERQSRSRGRPRAGRPRDGDDDEPERARGTWTRRARRSARSGRRTSRI